MAMRCKERTYIELHPSFRFHFPDLPHAIELMERRVLGTLVDLNNLVLAGTLLPLPHAIYTSHAHAVTITCEFDLAKKM